MNIIKQACGVYETNCYIVKGKKADVVIDPGYKALDFIKQHCTKLVAILNTHGHYDHVWDNLDVKEYFNCEIYCPKDDIFMLDDNFSKGFKKHSKYAKAVNDKETLVFNELEFTFHHFAGHTPGCSIIEFENCYFSGDFLFYKSIGRWDFPYSDAKAMINSLNKAKKLKDNFVLYPGHGISTNTSDEKVHLDSWIRYINANNS